MIVIVMIFGVCVDVLFFLFINFFGVFLFIVVLFGFVKVFVVLFSVMHSYY